MKKTEHLTLVGMSNAGKSYWANKLGEQGDYTKVCIDDLIEKRLGYNLKKDGYSGIQDVAKWMGMPYEPQSIENQAIYLEHEDDVMLQTLNTLTSGIHEKMIIDTTGSIIYSLPGILSGLRKYSTVILLDTPQELQAEMFAKFLREPKPVIWGDMYQPLEGEPKEETLARCYPLLLNSRNKMYRELAHLTIARRALWDSMFTAKSIVNLAQQHQANS